MDEEHDSELPWVQPLSSTHSIQTGMPIVSAPDVFPVNIALWPSTIDPPIKSYLVVHSDANLQ